ncbi:MFS transporter [Lactiplantibacillus pentosus]|uniref:MFS transporter n=1 Tax=Lactiplantibacillus pentosus TaxID=1589 RepID=UPI003C27C40A
MEKRQVHSGWLITLTSLGFFMAMMDSMIVTTASTAIKMDFHISVASLQWALNAYNVAIAAVLLVGVALGDRFGRRRVYNLGILVFTIGSILCALATQMPFLIIARIIEGAGASVMTPMSMAILTNAIPNEQRGKSLGIWSGIGGLALIVGPALGGLIVAELTWQWIFWINVPIGLAVIILSAHFLPESTGPAASINWLDVSLSMFAMTVIIWALSESTTGSNWLMLGSVFILGLAAGMWFIKRQRVSSAPLVSLRLFRNRNFLAGNLATFLAYAAMYGVVFFLPQYLQVVLRANTLQAGLALLPWTGTLVIVAPFAGKAVDHFGAGRVAILGLFCQGFGYLMIGELAAYQQAYIAMVVPLAIAGTGLSMAGPALQKVVLGAVTSTEVGQASGVYNVFRLLGGAVGTTIAVMVFTLAGNTQTTTMYIFGFCMVMLTTALLSVIGAGCAWLLRTPEAHRTKQKSV